MIRLTPEQLQRLPRDRKLCRGGSWWVLVLDRETQATVLDRVELVLTQQTGGGL